MCKIRLGLSWIVSRIWDWCLFQMFYIKTESLRTNYLYRKWSQILLSRHNTQSLTRGKPREEVSCCQKSLLEFLFARKMIHLTQFYNHDQNYPIQTSSFFRHLVELLFDQIYITSVESLRQLKSWFMDISSTWTNEFRIGLKTFRISFNYQFYIH